MVSACAGSARKTAASASANARGKCRMRIGIPPSDVSRIVRRAGARFKGCWNSGRELQVLDADDAVRRLLVVLQLRRIRKDQRLVVEIDQRLVGLDLGDRFFVGRLSLGRLGGAPGPR